MSMQQQMVEYMIQDMVKLITESKKIEYDEAMKILYSSEVYDKIVDIETGLYRESPYYVYDLLENELKHGHIVQLEE